MWKLSKLSLNNYLSYTASFIVFSIIPLQIDNCCVFSNKFELPLDLLCFFFLSREPEKSEIRIWVSHH